MVVAVLTLAVQFSPVCAGTLDSPPTHPAGVAGIAWGAKADGVKKLMLVRKEVLLTEETPARLVFTGGTFAGQTAERWIFIFSEGKFTEAEIRLKSADPLRQYEEMRKLITGKYRKTGREEREGSSHRATYWDYSLSTGKWGIACDVRTSGGVKVVYKLKSPLPPPSAATVGDI
jgi:hypothetical protein